MSAEAIETVKPVVETADTSITAVVELSDTTTTGVDEYADAKVMVHDDALEPVVNEPASSFALVPIAGDPVPHDEILGVARVLDAIM